MADTKETTKTQLPKYYYALGRRKTASATVRVFEGKGESEINGKPLAEYLQREMDLQSVQYPFNIAGLKPADFYFTVKVKGSGPAGQIGAIRLAISRALLKMNPDLRPALKKAGLLTRDPRMVERKKPGLRKARRAEQFSKR